MHKLEACYLHVPVNFPNGGGTESTLTQVKTPGMEMYHDDDKGNLVMYYKGKKLVIDWSGVKLSVYEEVGEKPKDKKESKAK